MSGLPLFDAAVDQRVVRQTLSIPYQRGSETSRAAAIRAQSFVGDQGEKVLIWVQSCGEHGATQKEAEAALTIGRPSLCARFRALEELRLIKKTGARRDGCGVYRAIDPKE